MLARYQIVRGKRPAGSPLPAGHRIDVRKHTRHILSPSASDVSDFLANPSASSFRKFSAAYVRTLGDRFRLRRDDFDALAEEAASGKVFIGCNCPTHKNPDVNRCHTVLALEFMKKKYPKLEVVFPE